MTRQIRLGVLGCGNVGAALVELVAAQTDAIEARTGLRLQVERVAVRNLSAPRAVQLPDGVLTRDAHAVVADPSIDLVVEVIGGIEPARELITTALRHGKPMCRASWPDPSCSFRCSGVPKAGAPDFMSTFDENPP